MSTDIVVRIPRDLIDFEQLEVVADALAMFTGERVEACEFMEVRTASPRAAAAMKALLQIDGDKPVAVETVAIPPSKDIAAQWQKADEAMPELKGQKRGGRGKDLTIKAQSKRLPHPNGPSRAWRVMQGGEVVERITVAEKDRRLSAGEFPIDTELHHPRAGHWRVKMGTTADGFSRVLVPVTNGHAGG